MYSFVCWINYESNAWLKNLFLFTLIFIVIGARPNQVSHVDIIHLHFVTVYSLYCCLRASLVIYSPAFLHVHGFSKRTCSAVQYGWKLYPFASSCFCVKGMFAYSVCYFISSSTRMIWTLNPKPWLYKKISDGRIQVLYWKVIYASIMIFLQSPYHYL